MTINRNGINCPGFEAALQFVTAQYPWMLVDLDSISLLPQQEMLGAFGLYHPVFRTVRISTAHDTVLDFIDTLVHELIHHIQYTTNALHGHEELEREANNYAYLAVKEYKTIKGIPLWK